MLRPLTLISAAALIAAAATLGFAQDNSTTAPAVAAAPADAAAPPQGSPASAPMMIAKGQSITIMADGSMLTAQPSEADAAAMVQDMKPLKGCVILMMSGDGQMYMERRGGKKCSKLSQM